jgi:hypothetical protein
MEFDNLKTAWQQRSVEGVPDRPNRELATAVRARLESLQSTIRWRDCREISAAIAGIIVFGIWFWTEPGIVTRIGAAVMVAGSVLIIARLLWARWGSRQERSHLQMREFCTTERDRIDAQIRLLRSVPWWYLGPTLLGTNLYVFGLVGYHAAAIGYLVFTLALGLALSRLNMRAVRKQLAPIKQELDLLLVEIEENENRSVYVSKS